MKVIRILSFVAISAAALILVLYSLPGRKCEDVPLDCQYDLNALKKTDPRLLIEAGVQFVKPTLSNLTALAVDADDNIYVGSQAGVEILSANGARVGGFAVAATVRCLAVSQHGEIFAGFKDHIEVYQRDGTRKYSWKSPDLKTELTSIGVSADFVFAADYANRTVWRYSRTGELLGRIGEKDSDQRKEGFVVPSAFFDLAVASDGSLWVVSPGKHRLEHFSPEGTYLSFWGQFGMDGASFCGCCNPSNIAIMPDGTFVTSEKHIVRVKLYDSGGKFKGIISGQEDWHRKAVGLDLAVDSKGRILVLDPQAGVVRVYTSEENIKK